VRELEAEIGSRDRDALRRQIADESGIPTLWARLQGDDARSLRADANRLRDELGVGKGALDGGVRGMGGVLGVGEKFTPVPWSTLNYDKDEGSYVVNLSREQLKSAPADSIEELTKDDGMGYRDRAYAYYKAKPYWQ